MSFKIPHLIPEDIRQLIDPFTRLATPADIQDEANLNIADGSGDSEDYEAAEGAVDLNLKADEKNNQVILFFSFKNSPEANFAKDGKDTVGSNNKLGFIPASYSRAFKNDISRKLLFNDKHIKEANGKSKDKLTIDTILDNLPAVQIREFLPDLKLDLMITALNVIIDKILSFTKDKSFSEIGNKLVDTFKGVASELASADIEVYKNFFKNLAMYLVNIKSEDSTFLNSFVNDLFSSDYTDRFNGTYKNLGRDYDAMLLKIPYTIWYGLLSTTTTNIYEVPFVNESKSLYSSNGSAGWQGSNTGFTASLVNAAKSIMGAILPNIGISFSPWWDSNSGQSTYDDDAVINFDLFNDTAEHAAVNFTFINTIIPNNKWMQYGLILHSPCLYDVRIEGVKRMYACTGEFKVTYSGKLRIPTYNFISNNLKHIGTIIPQISYQADYKNIKIPDVYHVLLSFKSLMPSNMNLFLFNYFGNKVITTIRDDGALEKLLQGASKVGSSIETMWNEAKKK